MVKSHGPKRQFKLKDDFLLAIHRKKKAYGQNLEVILNLNDVPGIKAKVSLKKGRDLLEW